MAPRDGVGAVSGVGGHGGGRAVTVMPDRKRGRPSSSIVKVVTSVGHHSRDAFGRLTDRPLCRPHRPFLCVESRRCAQCQGGEQSRAPHERLDHKPLQTVFPFSIARARRSVSHRVDRAAPEDSLLARSVDAANL